MQIASDYICKNTAMFIVMKHPRNSLVPVRKLEAAVVTCYIENAIDWLKDLNS